VAYTEENLRGRAAWRKYRSELVAKGVVMDWSANVPPPVPDDQNFFKAPKMSDWFIKKGPAGSFTSELSGILAGTQRASSKAVHTSPTNTIVIAEITVSSNAKADAGHVWHLDSPTAREEARKLVESAIGPNLEGAGFGYSFVAQPPPPPPQAAQITLQAQAATSEQIKQLFPSNSALPNVSRVRVEEAGSNSFRVLLSPPSYITAADYLAATEPAVGALDLIREAAKRPFARMDGDYEIPFQIGIPNFVAVRTVSQTLMQRAESFLLLNEPEKAWRELALIHDVCRMLEARPSGKPMTLVSAMIRVAVTGLYCGAVADGLRLHVWQEPQLKAIQSQLEEDNLLPLVVAAVECERVSICHTIESTKPGKMADIFAFGAPKRSLWQRIKGGDVLMSLVPKGWFYQNMIVCAQLDQTALDGIDLSRGTIAPEASDKLLKEVMRALSSPSPYNYLARIAIPNFTKAIQTTSRNQTTANEALIACALERFRLAEGRYPENVGELAPRFLDKLPADMVGGQPLKYRRAQNSFVLYSVGWNEKDENGLVAKDVTQGDWVWDGR
jgi:hypothetical protein